MGRSRLQKTWADYMAIAISPALIMALVGSLVFFLVEIGYEGPHESRLKWILFWFVFAAVLVSRIAIEQGRSQSIVYAAGLGIATFLVVLQYVQAVWLPIGLLILVWWCVDKLTWDCTLIDDGQDASGQGLMQVVGLDESEDSDAETVKVAEESTANNVYERISDWWSSWNRVGASPGLWVVYFSFAALPLFGVGQLVIPAADGAKRDAAFSYLLVYVTSAAGLLLTTSFLGLRRYLRQRRIQMPATVARTWFFSGLALLAGVLVVATLIPRPAAKYSLTALAERLNGRDQESSEYAMLNEDGALDDRQGPGQRDEANGQRPNPQPGQDEQGQQRPGEGRPGNQGAQNDSGQPTAGQQGPNGNGQGESGQDGQGQSGQGEQGPGQQSGQEGQNGQGEGKQDGQKNDDRGQRLADGNDPEAQSQQAQNDSDPGVLDQLTNQVGDLFKWIIYGLIGALLLYLILTNWRAIIGSIAAFINSILAFFRGLFGARERPQSTSVAVAEERPRIPFSAFADPFQTGRAQQMSGLELMQYSYQALLAWSDECGVGFMTEMTPEELAHAVEGRSSVLGPSLRHFAKLHTQVVFGPEKRLKKSQIPAVEKLWRRMTSHDPALVEARGTGG